MNPYVNFKGDCEEAFRLYEKTLGGRMGEIFPLRRIAVGRGRPS